MVGAEPVYPVDDAHRLPVHDYWRESFAAFCHPRDMSRILPRNPH
jgi:hypothetical protein